MRVFDVYLSAMARNHAKKTRTQLKSHAIGWNICNDILCLNKTIKQRRRENCIKVNIPRPTTSHILHIRLNNLSNYYYQSIVTPNMHNNLLSVFLYTYLLLFNTTNLHCTIIWTRNEKKNAIMQQNAWWNKNNLIYIYFSIPLDFYKILIKTNIRLRNNKFVDWSHNFFFFVYYYSYRLICRDLLVTLLQSSCLLFQ